MITRLKQRLAAEESGFTLIELLVVIIILGILLAIAVPSYLNIQERARNNAAQSNLRAMIPAVETFYADNGTYVGMTPAALAAIDQSINTTKTVTSTLTATSYCVSYAEDASHIARKAGPSA